MDEAGRRRSAPIAVDEALERHSDPVAQWLDWEAHANLRGFRTSAAPVQVDVVAVPRSDVEVHVLPGAPREVLDLFLRGDRVMIPRHPLILRVRGPLAVVRRGRRRLGRELSVAPQ